MPPDLVVLVRERVSALEADDPLFARIERKKIWLMVKKDLERGVIPYETTGAWRISTPPVGTPTSRNC